MLYTEQEWAERETALECRVQEMEREGVRVERERREEREVVRGQLREKELIIQRYIYIYNRVYYMPVQLIYD